MTRRLATALITAIASLATITRPSAQQVFSANDLTGSPYGMNGGLTDGQIVKKHEALAAIAEKAGDDKRATRHYAIACQYQAQSTHDVAMSTPLCATARALADRHDVVDAKISMLIATGVLRAWTHDFVGSVTTLKEAISLGKNLDPDDPDSAPLVGAHQLLGSTLMEMGQFEEARKSLTFGRDHCRTLGNAVCAAYADMWLCRLDTTLGDFSAARSACDAAQAEAAVHNDKLVLTNLGRIRGALEAAVHRPAAALAARQDAWRHASESSEPGILLPLIAQSIVDALIQLGRLDEAETWQRGLDDGLGSGKIPVFMAPEIAVRRGQIAALRGRVDEATTAFSIGSRSAVPDMSIRSYVGAARMHRYAGRFDAARDSLERAIDKIEEGRTNVTGSALRTSYLAMHASVYRDLVGVRWDAEGAAAGPAILELAEAGRARALLDVLASAQVAGAQAPTLSAAEIQARLAADEVLIEYVSSEERLIAITVTRDRIAVSPLERAGSAADLARRVDFFATMTQEGDEDAMAPAGERLYADLLAPALDGVAPSARTLIVSADGPLHGLPFDALGGAARVIDRWNVVMVPSASALAGRMPHGPPESPALIVTAPLSTEPGLPPLAAAPAEAAMIRGRVRGAIAELSGADATKARLVAAHPERFAVLHFASHALVDEERPLRSALVLADGGRWTAEEIYRSKLRADLVVLAACSTGAGAVAPGEGVMSLSRAFLHAGAAATVATLWDVPDAPAPAFADALYRELTNGRPLAVAVAEARRELRRNGAPPRAWAAYVMTGNPGAVVGVGARTPNRLIAAAVLAIIAGIMSIAALAVVIARLRWRFSWPQLATASVVLAASAVTLQWWPERTAVFNGGALALRGPSTAVIAPVLTGTAVTWTAVSGADEHVVEMFDGAGVPSGPAETTVSPFKLPDANGIRWMRVVARRDGHTIAQSDLMRVKQ